MSVTYIITRRPAATFHTAIVPMGWRNMTEKEKFRWVSDFVFQDPYFAHQYVGQRIKSVREYICIYTFHNRYRNTLQNYVEICVNGNEFFDIAIEDVEDLE